MFSAGCAVHDEQGMAPGRECAQTKCRSWNRRQNRYAQLGRDESKSDGNAYTFIECWNESNAGSGFAGSE